MMEVMGKISDDSNAPHKVKSNRNSNIEALKLIAIILIVISHSVPYVDNYTHPYLIDLRYSSESVQQVVMVLLRNFGQVGNLIFMVSSFWYRQDSDRIKVRKAPGIIFDTILISFFYAIISIILNISIEPWDFRMMLQPISFSAWWFVTCYLITYLIHPALNRAISIMSDRVMAFVVCVLAYAYSFCALLWRASFYYNNLIGFVYVYILVGAVHRFINKSIENPQDSKALAYRGITRWLTPCGIIFHIIFTIVLNFIGLHIEKFGNDMLRFNSIFNPVFILIAISAVLNALLQNTKKVQIINYFASLSLLIYLFHDSILVFKYLVPDVYYKWVTEHVNDGFVLPWVFVLAFVLFMGGLLLSIVYQSSVKRFTESISYNCAKVVERWIC